MDLSVFALKKNNTFGKKRSFLLSTFVFLLGIVVFMLLCNKFPAQLSVSGKFIQTHISKIIPFGCIFLIAAQYFSGLSPLGAVSGVIFTFISGVFTSFISLIYLNDITLLHKYVLFVLFLFAFIASVIYISDKSIVFSNYEFFRIRTDKRLRSFLFSGLLFSLFACLLIIVCWLLLNGPNYK